MAGPYILKDLLNYLDHCNTDNEDEAGECKLGNGMLFVFLILTLEMVKLPFLFKKFSKLLQPQWMKGELWDST